MSTTDTVMDYAHPLNPIVQSWTAKIKNAKQHKYENFGKWADLGAKFFDGAMNDVMWDDNKAVSTDPEVGFLARSAKGWKPTFRMTYNRMFEAVALFAPSMYFKNPNAQVTPQSVPEVDPAIALGATPEMLQDPMFVAYAEQQVMMMQQQQQMEAAFRKSVASVYGTYLNWLQKAAAKKRESRMAICEALIKGASYLWTDIIHESGSGTPVVTSQHISCDDIFKDPDAAHPRDVTWVARRCLLPVNKVEEKFGLRPGSLKGHVQSYSQKSEAQSQNAPKMASVGRTHDLIEFYEVYSKNGFGQLHNQSLARQLPVDPSAWGKYCRIVVADGVPYPLNIPPEYWQQFDPYGEEFFQAVSWPWPAWQSEPSGEGWPFVEFSLYEKAKSIWPVSIFKSVAGEMRFINWVLSFLADRIACSCQTIVAVAEHAKAKIREDLMGNSAPFAVVELSEIMGKSINEVIGFLQAPDLGTEIWQVVAAIDDKIDKRLGLTALLYGNTPTQMRSAQEASVKEQMVSIRPDDMANTVEDRLSDVIQNEAQCANFLLSGQEVAPVVGSMGAMIWDQLREQRDPCEIILSYVFRIEGGSSRKPNKDERAKKLQEMGQVAGPLIQQFALQGMTGPYNAYMTELCKANEIDPEPFLMPEFQPPDQGVGDGGAGAAAEHEQGMSHDAERHDQEMRQTQEKHDQDMEHAKAKNAAAVAAQRAKAAKKT